MPARLLTLLLSSALLSASLPSTALAQTEPAQSEPAQTEPAQTERAPAPPLTLSARPGTQVAYSTSSTVQFTTFEISFTALPGRVLSAAEQAQLKRLNENAARQFADLKALVGTPAVSTRTRQTVKVLPPDAAGNAVLLITVVTPPVIALRPGQASSSAQVARLTQTLSPTGQVVKFRVQTENPPLQQAYERLSYADLLSALSLSDTTPLYGLKLSPGETASAAQLLDLSPFFGSLADALGGPGTGISLRAQPLKLNVGTTFQNEEDGGARRYEQIYSAAPWKLNLSTRAADGQTITLRFATTDWSGHGTLSFRPDGLPERTELTQTLGMTLSAELPGLPVQLRATFGATLSLGSEVR
jgi:hypothetical protein